MKKNKVVIVGGGSTWTPGLLKSLCVKKDDFPLEELRLFDERYQNHSDNAAMDLVSRVFKVPESHITDIRCLKAGMTNKSFLFRVDGAHCICRIPGPGTELLINRREEKEVYDTVASLGITEEVLYMNPDTGYKIARYYENARNAAADNWKDMEICMGIVRKLHQSGLTVDHSFDIREFMHDKWQTMFFINTYFYTCLFG